MTKLNYTVDVKTHKIKTDNVNDLNRELAAVLADPDVKSYTIIAVVVTTQEKNTTLNQ